MTLTLTLSIQKRNEEKVDRKHCQKCHMTGSTFGCIKTYLEAQIFVFAEHSLRFDPVLVKFYGSIKFIV